MAEGSDDPFPEGLLAHAELQLRRAYEHSAFERAREVADRTGGGGAASTSDGPADVAALDPPSPNDGIVAALDALRRIAVESAARAGAHANEGKDDAADAKRRRKGEAGTAEAGGSDGGGDATRRGRHRHLAKSAPARFNRDVRSLTTALRGDWTTAYELIVARTIDASRAVARAESHAARSAWRRETIVSRHRELRATVAASGSRPPPGESPPGESPPVSDADARWRLAVSSGGLEAYAEAAEEVGNRAWVVDALRWCAGTAMDFILGGGAESFAVRSARRSHYESLGTRMSDEEEATMRAALRDRWHRRAPVRGDSPVGGDSLTGDKPTLIDVGSCWDYFRRHEDVFDVLALDLEPRRPTVLRCDFLNVRIGDPGLEDADVDAGVDADVDGALRFLPRNAAGAVVMSLVLSYVPTPRQRGEMVRRAREVLMDDGRGVLLIVTPHSTDKGHCAHKALPVLKEWRASIESMGFERVKYERARSVHCLAFRTVGEGPGTKKAGEAPPVRIAFDGPDWETKS
ncbi:predicted protein [Micromonas commoda]|uniref:Uncharacterized protein n=1 Tax=Micromonas commoda (strain RCC299 / NOUM17 / CCMP2709) TaxID=296587 RepID=C1EGJ3_MICCC|nr:predicted protein [Micromonas commoda]ACO67134.1 predicted protein [Micromonas commoda]|eukprot:XP_002505876.1 predicted protein [Micromonas commoda]